MTPVKGPFGPQSDHDPQVETLWSIHMVLCRVTSEQKGGAPISPLGELSHSLLFDYRDIVKNLRLQQPDTCDVILSLLWEQKEKMSPG